MKKNLFTLALALFVSVVAQAQVVITEIMYNPPEAGTDSLEYVELLNTSAGQVDVSGWNFTQGFEYVFPAGTILNPGEYVVISKTDQTFFSIFGFHPLIWVAGGALTNGGEDIELRDAAGTVIDYVDYKNVAPWPIAANGMGPSIVLCDPASDNSLPASWISGTTSTGKIVNNFEILANPGAASGCPSGTSAVDDQATITSGGTVTINAVANDLVPGTLGAVTIVTAPFGGTVTTNADNSFTYVGNANFCGRDSFIYRVCNTANSCDDAKVAVTTVCFPVRTLAQMTTENANGVADSLGKTCQVEGVVNMTNLRASGLQFSIQDGGAGVTVFRQTGNFGYTPTLDQRIQVRGTIQQFNGLTQLVADTVITTTTNTVLSPAAVLNPAEDQESEFIKINRTLTLVDPAQWTTGMGTGFTVQAVDVNATTDTIVIRIDNDILDFYNAPAPTGQFTIQGVCTQFDATDPFTTGYQILPRKIGDISTGLVHEPLEIDVTFAPNPVQDQLMIGMSEQIDLLLVTDMLGRQITRLAQPGLQTQLETSAWPSGVYAVTLYQSSKSLTLRVVKQ